LDIVKAVDTRGTRQLPKLTGLGVIESVEKPYPAHLFNNPIVLPPCVLRKGQCSQLEPYVDCIKKLFGTSDHANPINEVLDDLVFYGTFLQKINNLSSIGEVQMSNIILNELFYPLLKYLNIEVAVDAQMETFIEMLNVVVDECMSRLKDHPDMALILVIKGELEMRMKKYLLGGKKFNVGSVLRTTAFARALVWIATDHQNEAVPRDRAEICDGLGFGRNSSIVKLIVGYEQ